MEYDLWRTIVSAAVIDRLWFSLWESSVTVALALLLGGGLALIERIKRCSAPRWLIIICAWPIFLPPAIVGGGFIQLLGQTGDLNSLLTFFHVPTLHLLYRPSAVIIAHLYYNVPLAYLAVRAGLDHISQHTEDAAKTCGATTWQLWRTIYWPQLRLALAGIAGIIFLYSFTSFVLPLQLGGIQAQTLEVWLYQQIVLWHNYQAAWLVALVQAIVLGFVVFFLGRIQFEQSAAWQPMQPRTASKRWINSVRGIFVGLILAPLISLISHVFIASQWLHLQQLWSTQFFFGVGRSLLLTVVVVGAAVLITAVLRLPMSLALLLLVLSPVTLGFIWRQWLGQGYLSLALALIVGILPIASFFIDQAIKQQPRFWQKTLAVLGANGWQQRQFTWHWLCPTMQRVAALGSVFVLGDVTLASLLAKHDAHTGMQIAFGLISHYRFQLGGLALVIMLCTIFLTQLVWYARR